MAFGVGDEAHLVNVYPVVVPKASRAGIGYVDFRDGFLTGGIFVPQIANLERVNIALTNSNRTHPMGPPCRWYHTGSANLQYQNISEKETHSQ